MKKFQKILSTAAALVVAAVTLAGQGSLTAKAAEQSDLERYIQASNRSLLQYQCESGDQVVQYAEGLNLYFYGHRPTTVKEVSRDYSDAKLKHRVYGVHNDGTKVSTYTYDQQNNVIGIASKRSDGYQSTMGYQYDAAGNMIASSYNGESYTEDPVQLQYDEYGRISVRAHSYEGRPAYDQYQYQGVLLTGFEYPGYNGETNTYSLSYDKAGRVTGGASTEGSDPAEYRYEFKYNKDGSLATASIICLPSAYEENGTYWVRKLTYVY